MSATISTNRARAASISPALFLAAFEIGVRAVLVAVEMLLTGVAAAAAQQAKGHNGEGQQTAHHDPIWFLQAMHNVPVPPGIGGKSHPEGPTYVGMLTPQSGLLQVRSYLMRPCTLPRPRP